MNQSLPKRSISISLQRQIENYELLSHKHHPKGLKSATQPPKQNITDYYQIPHIPQIHLSIKQLNSDPIELLTQLQQQHLEFGAVKLITPPEWNPPFSLKYTKTALTTRLQPIHKLKHGKVTLLYRFLRKNRFNFQQKKQAYTLQSYQQFALEFQRRYKFKFQERGSSRLEKLENEYWNLVKGPSLEQYQSNPKKYNVTVEYAADLPSNRLGSGFPQTQTSKSKDQHYNYADNLFNLNNIYKSQKSLLKISDLRHQYIGGITIPWVYIGMMFSSFCWHVQDSNINSINYNHCGGSKIWYVIPQSDKQKFDRFVQKKYGDKSQINKITYMLDPLEIMNNNIKIFKAYQRPKEYIVTFFKAYHCGFSHSFNIGEAVNFVFPSSVKYIKEYISRSTRPSIFCYEWMIHQNYMRQIREEIIQKEYRSILQKQQKNLQKLKVNKLATKVEMILNSVRYDRYICCKCKQYTYLSLLRCQDCLRYFCLNDVVKCCPLANMVLMIRQPNADRMKYINRMRKMLSD